MVRDVEPEDAERVCWIYNHYVTKTTITFEEEPVSVEQMRARITEIRALALSWIVYGEAGAVVGFTYYTLSVDADAGDADRCVGALGCAGKPSRLEAGSKSQGRKGRAFWGI
jgi:hypothetical protein